MAPEGSGAGGEGGGPNGLNCATTLLIAIVVATPQSYDGAMPTVLRSGPYRFFFYAGDRDEPPHIHVERDDDEAKFWLDPVRIQWSVGFSAREIRTMEKLVKENQQLLLERWHEFFNG